MLTVPDCAPGTEVVLEGSELKEKPAEISADDFFSVEMTVKDFTFQLDGKNFATDNKIIKTKKIKDGTVG